MRPKEEHDTTTNRSVYNRRHKEVLVEKGEVHCAYCRYHKGENKGNYRPFGMQMPRRKNHRNGHNPRTVKLEAAS